MNPPKLGRKRRSAYSRQLRARNRRVVQVLGGLACLLVWLAYAKVPQSASGGWAESEAELSTSTTPVDPPSVDAAVSAQHALVFSLVFFSA